MSVVIHLREGGEVHSSSECSLSKSKRAEQLVSTSTAVEIKMLNTVTNEIQSKIQSSTDYSEKYSN